MSKEDQFEEKCKAIFQMFDIDGDGQLTEEEIMKGYHMFDMNPTEEDIKQTMKDLDIDESGTIDYDEFKSLMWKIDQDEERDNVAQAFRKFDRRRRGYLDKRQFSSVLNAAIKGESGEKFSKEDVDKFFKVVDTDNNGKIDLEEFITAFTGEVDIFASIRKPEYEVKAEAEEQKQET
ncbi:Calmodulin, striated muscle [Mizuhopecten yessoensis]|uniref:Calmodulin, striated muscle n=3 Tax=Mizuhopecten yessoensis TaxID=6573 RepID=A0A210QMU8_MIZYE|nr:Calmodulin, striated muscle [Mizuhopecten yessoensis]